MKKTLFAFILLVVLLAACLIIAARADEQAPVENNDLRVVFMDGQTNVWGYMGPHPHVSWYLTYGECSIYEVEKNEHSAFMFDWSGYDSNYFYWTAQWRPGWLDNDPRHTYILEWCRVHTSDLQLITYSVNTPLTWDPNYFDYEPAVLRGYPEP